MTQYTERDVDIFQQFESFDFDRDEQFQQGWQSILKRLGNSATRETLFNAKVFFFSRQLKPLDLDSYLSWKKTKKDKDYHEDRSASALPSAVNDNQTDSHEERVNKTSPELESNPLTLDNTESASCITSTPEKEESQNSEVSSCHIDSASIAAKFSQGSTPSAKISAPSTPIVCDSDQILKPSDSHVSDDGTDKSNPTSQSQNGESTHSNEDSEIQPSLSLAEIAELIQNQQPIPGLVKLDVQPTNSSPTPSALAMKPKPWQRTEEESLPSVVDAS